MISVYEQTAIQALISASIIGSVSLIATYIGIRLSIYKITRDPKTYKSLAELGYKSIKEMITKLKQDPELVTEGSDYIKKFVEQIATDEQIKKIGEKLAKAIFDGLKLFLSGKK